MALALSVTIQDMKLDQSDLYLASTDLEWFGVAVVFYHILSPIQKRITLAGKLVKNMQ